VVAFAFGLAAASFFPVIIMGIFSSRINKEGAIVGMISGLVFTLSYITYFKFGQTLLGLPPEALSSDNWWFGISPEGIGSIGMMVNFLVCYLVSKFTSAPPQDVQDMIQEIRIPRGAGNAHDH
jgi:cation/acetate symporter